LLQKNNQNVMDVASLPFALFVIASIFIFYLLKRGRIVFLLALSGVFIAGFSYLLLIYVLLYALINYLIGLKIPLSRHKTLLFRLGIAFNLLQLILLKYSSFALDPVFRLFNSDIQFAGLSELVIPLGISFFTLQGIGYLVNLKMGWEKPEKKLHHFILYIIFFPKFLSGPIERSNHFLPQLDSNFGFQRSNIVEGLRIALIGFFKKIVIANQLGIVVNSVYADPDAFGGINVWIVMLLQPLYLYFDFSGYTDIARGIAKAYGFDLLPNFNKPFLSENITTFWRRMHISLSSWFNDYVFKQVSFKYRKAGIFSSTFAVFVTFTLFGIWHGAGWNYMILGILQAVAITFEFFTKEARISIFSHLSQETRIWAGRICTYLFFAVSHVFFFAPNMETAIRFYSKLDDIYLRLYLGISSRFVFLLAFGSLVIFMVLEILNLDLKNKYARIENFWNKNKALRMATYYLVIIFIISQLGGAETFIYQVF
jgi:alginate O-acetyltransferase complex protein AlgI